MFLILIIIFTVIPILEITLLINISSTYGFFNTILLVIFTGIYGAYLSKKEGISCFYDIQKQLSIGKFPQDELIQGFLIFGGGLLLLTPGILTDVFGFSMVIPLTRKLLMTFIKKYFTQLVLNGKLNVSGFDTKFKYNKNNLDTFEADFKEKD